MKIPKQDILDRIRAVAVKDELATKQVGGGYLVPTWMIKWDGDRPTNIAEVMAAAVYIPMPQSIDEILPHVLQVNIQPIKMDGTSTWVFTPPPSDTTRP